MALINCPECGKEVSDKAKSCPNCGCPINNEKFKIIITSYYSDTSALAGISQVLGIEKEYEEGMLILNNLPYCIAEYDTEAEANLYASRLKSPMWGLSIELISPEGKNLLIVDNSITKCPTCGSTDVSRVSAVSRVAGAVLFGLLSNKRKMRFHCNHCHYEW